MTWTATLGLALTAYVLLTARTSSCPQATLAWMLLFVAAPGIGLVIFFLFGRDRRAFSRERTLARQNLEENAAPILQAVRAREDAGIGTLEGQSPVRRRLMRLIRRNSHSLLTTHDWVEIQQNASVHYPSLIADLKGAGRSIQLLYFIWADDAFTRELKAVLVERARAGVEVRLLYDPVGSFFPDDKAETNIGRQGAS